MSLQSLVNEALENAVDNGYDVVTATPEVVAEDLGRYCAGLEGYPLATLQQFVAEWQSVQLADVVKGCNAIQ